MDEAMTGASSQQDAAATQAQPQAAPGGGVLVIIPAYNEAANIARVVAGVAAALPGADVVVVNDGSSDDTAGEARRAGATVLTLNSNMGYGVALQTGYKFAARAGRYHRVVQMDGDGQHDPSNAASLLREMESGDADLVIGSRFTSAGNGYRVPLLRRCGISFFSGLVRLVTGREIRDVTSGLQAFNARVLDVYVSEDFPSYYPDADVLVLLLKCGLRVREAPARMHANGTGKSMHKGLWNNFYYIVTMLLSISVIILRERLKRFLSSKACA